MYQKSLRSAAQVGFLLTLLLVAIANAGVKYRVLHNFQYGENYQIGSPSGTVILDAEGNVYGATGAGGIGCAPFGCGVIYEFTPKGGSLVYEFSGGNGGAFPQQILFDSAGNLYGNLDGGGAASGLYELAHQGEQWNFNMFYTSGGCCLVFDKGSNIYGSIGAGNLGAGAIGELSPGANGWTYTQLYSFCSLQGGCPDGEEPQSPLSWDSKGNLYGTTLYGGVSTLPCPGSLGCGVAFQMTPNGDGAWTYHVMHRFASYKGDGMYPYAGLTVDAFGNAYGATESGGAYGNGTLFKLSPSAGGWKKTVLYEFPNCAEGCVPSYTLVFDKAGNLYGSGGGGNPACGSYTCGTIFRLVPQAGGKWKYQVVYKFSGTDGAFPYGVVLDNRGHMFGTTSGGGTYNSGVLFEITQ
jgi:uncharacterized repeat protein (TIGR03803 family)